MAAWKQFEDVEAWQAARRLNAQVWALVKQGAFGKDFALVDQINRSAGSTMDNIAEGFDAGSNAEFVRFLRYSQRSCSEVKSQLFRALDRSHIDKSTFDALQVTLSEISNKSGGLIKYLRSEQQRTKNNEPRTAQL